MLTGADLAEMDDAHLGLEVLVVLIYARMDPAQKIRIVRPCRRTASSSR